MSRAIFNRRNLAFNYGEFATIRSQASVLSIEAQPVPKLTTLTASRLNVQRAVAQLQNVNLEPEAVWN